MTERHHFLDTCRALLMFLGIPYHVALVYSGDGTWLVNASETSHAFGYAALLTNAFRMPAFFVVAGFFSMLLIARKGPRQWFGRRIERIVVPLIVALAISTPIQIVAIQYVAAMRADLEFAPGDILSWPLAWLADPASDKVFHLWFLPELLIFSALLALLVASGLAPRMTRLLDLAARVPFGPFAGVLLAGWGVYAYGVYASERLLGRDLFLLGVLDVQSLLRHLPFFLFGAVLATRRAFFERFTRPSKFAWICAIAALGVWVGVGTEPDRVSNLVRVLIGPTTAILMTHVVLSGARALLDRPTPLVRLGTESAFTVYLAHQPIIMVLTVILLAVDLAPAPGFLLMVTATTLIALGLHLVVRRSRILSYIFNGVRPPAPAERPKSGSPAQLNPGRGGARHAT